MPARAMVTLHLRLLHCFLCARSMAKLHWTQPIDLSFRYRLSFGARDSCREFLGMNEILVTIRQRFTKGLREAPYQFVALIIAVARGIRSALRATSQRLGAAAARTFHSKIKPR